MRRLSGILVASAFVLLPALAPGGAGVIARLTAQAAAAQAQKLTFEGDAVIWTVVVKPDKTADYEALMGKVKAALMKSDKPERKQQAAGWRVLKGQKAMADGNIVYQHIITPVKDADYTILAILYEGTTDPAEQKTLYDLYRGALAGSAPPAPYTQVLDLGK